MKNVVVSIQGQYKKSSKFLSQFWTINPQKYSSFLYHFFLGIKNNLPFNLGKAVIWTFFKIHLHSKKY